MSTVRTAAAHPSESAARAARHPRPGRHTLAVDRREPPCVSRDLPTAYAFPRRPPGPCATTVRAHAEHPDVAALQCHHAFRPSPSRA